MLLNRLEFLLTNNPLRGLLQRRLEASILLKMGGRVEHGTVLELGCGRGIGAQLILEQFGAARVEAFDLDPRMLDLARQRSRRHSLGPIHYLQASATALPLPEARYDAVFDFAVIHHIEDWRRVLEEVYRVLKPGGRFYADEVLARAIGHPLLRRLLHHPQADRFDSAGFCAALESYGFELLGKKSLGDHFAWFVARKPQD